jgi:hypothetical protein
MTEIESRHFPGGTEKGHENFRSGHPVSQQEFEPLYCCLVRFRVSLQWLAYPVVVFMRMGSVPVREGRAIPVGCRITRHRE